MKVCSTENMQIAERELIVSGSDAYFPAMLFQYVKDGEGVSPVISFAHIGYAQARDGEELHEGFSNTGGGQFHQGSGWCSANDEFAFRDLHIFRRANFHGWEIGIRTAYPRNEWSELSVRQLAEISPPQEYQAPTTILIKRLRILPEI